MLVYKPIKPIPMKPLVLRSVLIFTLFVCFGTVTSQSCNFNINNAMQCHLDVSVYFYDTNGLCSTDANPSVPASSTWVANCTSACGTLTNVEVKINAVGGGAFGIAVDINNQTVSGTIPNGSCAGMAYFVNWIGGGTDADIGH